MTLGYFEQKSTVDYIGAVQGIPVCFDAKECTSDTFALQNLHEHQVKFMTEFEKQGGIAFLIIYYTKRDEIFYLPFRDMIRFWKRMEEGGRKSIRYEELNQDFRLARKQGIFIPYLDGIQKDLQVRD